MCVTFFFYWLYRCVCVTFLFYWLYNVWVLASTCLVFSINCFIPDSNRLGSAHAKLFILCDEILRFKVGLPNHYLIGATIFLFRIRETCYSELLAGFVLQFFWVIICVSIFLNLGSLIENLLLCIMFKLSPRMWRTFFWHILIT